MVPIFFFAGGTTEKPEILFNVNRIICVKRSGNGAVVHMSDNVQLNLPDVTLEQLAQLIREAK